jgi:hypothetical protein
VKRPEITQEDEAQQDKGKAKVSVEAEAKEATKPADSDTFEQELRGEDLMK